MTASQCKHILRRAEAMGLRVPLDVRGYVDAGGCWQVNFYTLPMTCSTAFSDAKGRLEAERRPRLVAS